MRLRLSLDWTWVRLPPPVALLFLCLSGTCRSVGVQANTSTDGTWKTGLWSSERYLELHPDVRAAGVEAWEHYKVSGYREGREIGLTTNITGRFNADGYYAIHADVRHSTMGAWAHYSTFGHDEGRLIAVTPSNVPRNTSHCPVMDADIRRVYDLYEFPGCWRIDVDQVIRIMTKDRHLGTFEGSLEVGVKRCGNTPRSCRVCSTRTCSISTCINEDCQTIFKSIHANSSGVILEHVPFFEKEFFHWPHENHYVSFVGIQSPEVEEFTNKLFVIAATLFFVIIAIFLQSQWVGRRQSPYDGFVIARNCQSGMAKVDVSPEDKPSRKGVGSSSSTTILSVSVVSMDSSTDSSTDSSLSTPGRTGSTISGSATGSWNDTSSDSYDRSYRASDGPGRGKSQQVESASSEATRSAESTSPRPAVSVLLISGQVLMRQFWALLEVALFTISIRATFPGWLPADGLLDIMGLPRVVKLVIFPISFPDFTPYHCVWPLRMLGLIAGLVGILVLWSYRCMLMQVRVIAYALRRGEDSRNSNRPTAVVAWRAVAVVVEVASIWFLNLVMTGSQSVALTVGGGDGDSLLCVRNAPLGLPRDLHHIDFAALASVILVSLFSILNVVAFSRMHNECIAREIQAEMDKDALKGKGRYSVVPFYVFIVAAALPFVPLFGAFYVVSHLTLCLVGHPSGSGLPDALKKISRDMFDECHPYPSEVANRVLTSQMASMFCVVPGAGLFLSMWCYLAANPSPWPRPGPGITYCGPWDSPLEFKRRLKYRRILFGTNILVYVSILVVTFSSATLILPYVALSVILACFILQGYFNHGVSDRI